MGDDFYRTRMGQKFFESTVPRIADALARLNRNLETLVALLERRREGVPLDRATESGDSAPSTRAPGQRR